jgi:hypothetical protein
MERRLLGRLSRDPGKPGPAQVHPANGGHMSAVLPSIVSAVAATIAAAFAGLTLYVSGRREHLQWIRESLLGSYENYLTASFDAPGRHGRQPRLRGDEGKALEEHRRKAADAQRRQTATLTKLRMIAPSSVVAAAEALHEADHAVVDAALDGPDVPDEDNWRQLRMMQWTARSAFVDQVRRSLGLGPSAPIGHKA